MSVPWRACGSTLHTLTTAYKGHSRWNSSSDREPSRCCKRFSRIITYSAVRRSLTWLWLTGLLVERMDTLESSLRSPAFAVFLAFEESCTRKRAGATGGDFRGKIFSALHVRTSLSTGTAPPSRGINFCGMHEWKGTKPGYFRIWRGCPVH